jgi:hypothetical protein
MMGGYTTRRTKSGLAADAPAARRTTEFVLQDHTGSCKVHVNAMKTVIALVGLLASQQLLAVEAPKVVTGDFRFVYARVVNCGPELQAIDYAEVDENGIATFFGDVSLAANGKAVFRIRNELVDELEKRTGHRSKTLELIHVPGSDEQAVAWRLLKFSMEAKACSPMVLPPTDPNWLDPDWRETFERLVLSPHNRWSQPQAAAWRNRKETGPVPPG